MGEVDIYLQYATEDTDWYMRGKARDSWPEILHSSPPTEHPVVPESNC
jgi:hypothetical protein